MKERSSPPSDFELAIARREKPLEDPDVVQYLHNSFGDIDAPAAFKVRFSVWMWCCQLIVYTGRV